MSRVALAAVLGMVQGMEAPGPGIPGFPAPTYDYGPGSPYHKPNGGRRSGAAAAKRAARTRRNIQKNRRGAR